MEQYASNVADSEFLLKKMACQFAEIDTSEEVIEFLKGRRPNAQILQNT